LGNWQSLRTGEQGTERQEVLGTLRAPTAAVSVEGDVATDIVLSFGTAVPEQFLRVGI
jgi:hypothetical protein